VIAKLNARASTTLPPNRGTVSVSPQVPRAESELPAKNAITVQRTRENTMVVQGCKSQETYQTRFQEIGKLRRAPLRGKRPRSGDFPSSTATKIMCYRNEGKKLFAEHHEKQPPSSPPKKRGGIEVEGGILPLATTIIAVHAR